MTETSEADWLVAAIRTGDADAVERLVASDPALASSPLGGRCKTRTPLHVVTDWPGYFPNGPEVVRVLIAAGADPDTRSPGDETPLHWAASSDDVDVAAALIDGGADVEAPGGSIGTPLDNAIGYGCWQVARLLAERGARIETLWHAAALGMTDRLRELLSRQPAASTDDVSKAFWHACAAGRRRAAELLLDEGADLNWIPDYAKGTPLEAAQSLGTQRENLIGWLRDKRARTSGQPG
jgi:ankyrin repeat protein